ncbi:MAG TPA: hypothetical protein DEF39_08190 [Hungateiclostridium thermocellum]|nr:hypothetical protein [Acetivibrio thermocellus]
MGKINEFHRFISSEQLVFLKNKKVIILLVYLQFCLRFSLLEIFHLKYIITSVFFIYFSTNAKISN